MNSLRYLLYVSLNFAGFWYHFYYILYIPKLSKVYRCCAIIALYNESPGGRRFMAVEADVVVYNIQTTELELELTGSTNDNDRRIVVRSDP